jgi:hypothetical protein
MKKQKMEKQKSILLDESHEELDKFMEWTPDQVAVFLKKAGLGGYGEVFQNHKISGRLLHLLTDQDLKDMGIKLVGDKLRIKTVIQALERKQRYAKRTKVWWEGTERLYFSKAEKNCVTCCGICPDGKSLSILLFHFILPAKSLILLKKNTIDPSTYKLTSNHLKIKTVNPYRLGPTKLPCCYEYTINNLDLTGIDDVDVIGEPSPCCYHTCCCAPGKGHVEVSSKASKGNERIVLTLTVEEAEKACALILQQIEECQRMERE